MPDTIVHHHTHDKPAERPDLRRREPPRTMKRLARNIWLARDWVDTVFNCVEELVWDDFENFCPSALYRVVIHYFKERSTAYAIMGISAWEWCVDIAPMNFAEDIVDKPDFLNLLEAFSADHECAFYY